MEDNEPRQSFECSRSSIFRQTRGLRSIRIERYRHRACTKTCPDATSAALTHKRSSTEFFLSNLHLPRDIDLSFTFPLALRPVSHIVTPLCLSRSTRSDDPTEPGWKVMLVAMVKGQQNFERLRDPYVGVLDFSDAAKSVIQAG